MLCAAVCVYTVAVTQGGGADRRESIMARKLADEKTKETEMTEEELVEFKKLYTAPDPGTANSKLLKMTGEVALASEKAQKMLGKVSDTVYCYVEVLVCWTHIQSCMR